MAGQVENIFLQNDVNKKFTKELEAEEYGSVKIGMDDIDGEEVFKRYRDIEEIAQEIAVNEYLDKNQIIFNTADISKLGYRDIIDNGLTFFMSSGHKKSGLLSICPAILTALKVWEKLPSSDQKIKDKLLSNITISIKALFKIIYRDKEFKNADDAPVIDASPYETDAFSPGLDGKSYIDSISWAVPVFLRILNLKDKDNNFVFKEFRDISKFLAKWCLRYINKSVIWENDVRPIGWSFTKLTDAKRNESDKAERSLYFTYAASTVYLSFYAEYSSIIEAFRVIETSEKKVNDKDYVKLGLSDQYWKNVDEIKKNYNILKTHKGRDEFSEKKLKNCIDMEKALEILMDSDKAEAIEDIMYFYDDKRITNEYINYENENDSQKNENALKEIGQLARLKWNLEKIAEEIWTKVGNRLENDFFYEDFEATKADNKDIENGGQTNALFTGLLKIGILLNAAYDIKIKNENEKAYERMLDTLLLHVQKTQRFFDKLEDDGRTFGVDTLILRFMEKLYDDPKDIELADKLRKCYIRVCSLTPLLLKTNNLLSEYAIKYPQKQMGESLLSISKNRFFEKVQGKNEINYRLLWEKDGYHVITNYYYVGAIFDFYTYYYTYEKKYLEKPEETKKRLLANLSFDKGIRAYLDSEKEKREELEKKFEMEKEVFEKENKDLKTKINTNEVRDNLIQNIIQVIDESGYFESQKFLAQIIKNIREKIASELLNEYIGDKGNINDEKRNDFIKSMFFNEYDLDKEDIKLFPMLQELFTDIILASAIAGRREGSGNIEKLGKDCDNNSNSIDFTIRARKRLVKDKRIEKLFALMFNNFQWDEFEK